MKKCDMLNVYKEMLHICLIILTSPLIDEKL